MSFGMHAEASSTDSLNRRLRHAKPQPVKRALTLSDRDLLIFQKINTHGPLPSSYLFKFSDHLGAHQPSFQRRLTHLYNGAQEAPPFLSRPAQQWASYNARYQPVIYDLSFRAERILAEYGVARVARSDPFLHRVMSACVTASIELACHRHGLRFIDRSEIWAHQSCPLTTRTSADPLALPLGGNRMLIPDGLFGIEYPGTRPSYRFFALEIDRNTESIERRRVDQTSFGRKMENYATALKRGLPKSHWGVPALMVLTVTNNAAHMANILRHLDGGADRGLNDRFLFKARPEFGANWRVPDIMCDLLNRPWYRSGHPPFAVDRC